MDEQGSTAVWFVRIPTNLPINTSSQLSAPAHGCKDALSATCSLASARRARRSETRPLRWSADERANQCEPRADRRRRVKDARTGDGNEEGG